MHIFFSDVHLMNGRNDDIERRERVIRFLRQIAVKSEGLWIGGDLFDFWFEWNDDFPDVHNDIINELRSLVEQGVPVHILPGNHDFALGSAFMKNTGGTVHPSPSEVVVDGIRVHWNHGDGTAPSDVGYRILKRVLHNKFAQWCFGLIPRNLAMKIALWTSKSSRYKSETVGIPPDTEYDDYARKILASGEINAVVMGHTHLPKVMKIGKGWYINTGDFIIENTYAILENGDWRIERFEYDEKNGHNQVRK